MQSTPPSQPRKRPRLPADGPLLRTAIACRACRDRKTRCSGDQPACRYCVKAGLRCEYASAAVVAPVSPSSGQSALNEWGDRILGAIDALGRGRAIEEMPRVDSIGPTTATLQGIIDHRFSAANLWRGPIPIDGLTVITNLEPILAWNVFSDQRDAIAVFLRPAREFSATSRDHNTTGKESASCDVRQLLGLLSTFETYILPGLPILDIGQLRRYISLVGEYGVPWSADACLLLLVAALASNYRGELEETSSSESESARRYWNMAKKRLAWALEEHSLLGAQCQLLAGIWYLWNFEPNAACRMVTGALEAVDSIRHGSLLDESAGAAIRAVCVAVLCKLRCEIRSSIAPSIYNPPESNPETCYILESEGHNHGRPGSAVNVASSLPCIWLSALCIRQHAIQFAKDLHIDMSLHQISIFHEGLTAIHQALDTWYAGIPLHLQQTDPPTTHHYGTSLDTMYYETKELLLRPYVYLSLHAESIQAPPSESDTPREALRGYYAAQIRKMTLQHRSAAVAYINSSLCAQEQEARAPSWSGMGWLRMYTCMAVALVLLASVHGGSIDEVSNEGSSLQERDFAILVIEDSLRRERKSDAHAALLRAFRGAGRDLN
ncbi:hypothetical protein BJX62DRAFT_232119 [Aspergillus germanicus]